MTEFLNNLLVSLCSIEVKGKNNLDVLLGCIMAIEKMIAKIEAEESTGTEEDNG